jgi:hypothetical protein
MMTKRATGTAQAQVPTERSEEGRQPERPHAQPPPQRRVIAVQT